MFHSNVISFKTTKLYFNSENGHVFRVLSLMYENKSFKVVYKTQFFVLKIFKGELKRIVYIKVNNSKKRKPQEY